MDGRYKLAFIEFGDQGSLLDNFQLKAALDVIHQAARPELFVYIHGWQNSAIQPSASPQPTSIPLTTVPAQAQLTAASLQEIDANVSRDLSSVADVTTSLSGLKNEIDARLAEDMKRADYRGSNR